MNTKANKKIVSFGEVLLRLSPPQHQRFQQASSLDLVYGGSELNVALSLANFGLPVDFVTRMPDNPLGLSAISHARKYGVSTENIVFGGDRLGLYFIEMGAGLRGSQVVYDRKFSSISTIERGMIDWKNIFSNADWFHWSGITAGVSEGAADSCMEAIEIASKMGLTISTDFNYRAGLWNYGKSPQEIMEPMIQLCDVVLAGDYASDKYFNIKPENKENPELSLARQLKNRFPQLSQIAITRREMINASRNNWSAFLYDKEDFYKSQSYELTDIVDRIGTGDSFMAGLIYGLRTFKEDTLKALDFATAASALKHTISGDSNLVTVEETLSLMEGDRSGRVKR